MKKYMLFIYIICFVFILALQNKKAEAGKYIAGDNSRNIINHYLTLDKIHKWEKESLTAIHENEYSA